jgi:DUF1680 family protein
MRVHRLLVLALSVISAVSAAAAPGDFLARANLNRKYVLSLKNENLLQNYYLEAALWSPRFRMTSMGWESPPCQWRGRFLGHWLSATASIAAAGANPEVRGKADYAIAELARAQKANGGRWAASIPEKSLFTGNVKAPESILAADNEREWATRLGGYGTVNHTITDQTSTMYLPVAPR